MYPTRSARHARKILRISTLIVLMLVTFATLLSVTCSHAAQASANIGPGRVVKAGVFNFKPLVIFDQKSPPTGFIVDILNHIAKQEEWNMEYVPGTWQESLERLRTDKIDIILCIGYSAERDEYLDFPKEHVLLDWGLVYRKKGSSINTILDMEGKTIAAMKASIYMAGFENTLEQFNIKAKIVEKTEVKDVFGALESGEVDAAISSSISGLSFESSQRIDRSPVVFTPVKLGYAVNSGKNADLTAAIDKRLAELKSNKNSYYYKKLDEWVTASVHNVPKALYWVIGSISGALFIFIVFVIILRWQVRAKTNSLKVEIEQRIQAEESLKMISSRQSAILVAVPDIIMETDTNKVYTWANSAGLEFFGDDVIGREASYYFEGEQDTYEVVQPLLDKSKDVIYVESLQRRKDGAVRLLAWWCKLLKDEQGAVAGVLSSARDITAQKQIEYELKMSEERFRLILETVAVVPWEFNIPENRWVYVGSQVTGLLGYAPEEWTTLEWWLEIIHPEDKTWVPTYCADLTSRGEEHSMEYRLLAKDGSFVWVNDLVTVEMLDGKPHIMRGVIVDINNRKKAEEEKHLLEQQFQQTQKLESLGVLAGGIAHDFNNILAIIMGYCSLTKMDYENSEANIPEIEKAAERAAALCRQMLAYAGKASLIQTQFNVWMLVDEMVTMLKATIQKNVVIKSSLGTDIPVITGDASQIRQVVMNLIINAAEAIGDAEGEINVRLAKAEIGAGQAEKDHLGFIIPAGRYICIEVTDNGCGMDEETRGKIFEPFYTTKFTGRGLGMSAVLGIIKAHNGALQLESRLGQGTTFRVYLPAQLSKSETEEAQQIAASTAWKG